MKTLEEIKNCGKEMLTPTDVAGYLGCDPYSINLAAKQMPNALGFPFSLIGTRVRIPREGFVRWASGIQPQK